MSIYQGTNLIASVSSSTPLLSYQYTDHILNDVSQLRANNFSWQSGDVYSAAYNHLYNDLQESTFIKGDYKNSNITNVGLSDVRGVLTGFTTTTKYATFKVKTPTRNLELVMDLVTPTTYANASSFLEASQQYKGVICRFTTAGVLTMWMSSNGTSWNVMSNWATGITISANTKAKFKLTWDGSVYAVFYSLDGGNSWIAGNTLSSTLPIFWNTGEQGIGGASWESYAFTNGTINLPGCYAIIDDETFWQGVYYEFDYYLAKDNHKIVLPENESKVLSRYNETGSCWCFILDTDNRRFKLPRDKHRRIVEQYSDGLNWYKIYSDGWCEQGGSLICNTEGIRYVDLQKKFKDKNYTVLTTLNAYDNRTSSWSWQCYVNNKTSAGFGIYNAVSTAAYLCHWTASGYLDKTQYQQIQEEYLYFYVGAYKHSAIQQTAGINEEMFNDKIDVDFNNVTSYEKIVENVSPGITDNAVEGVAPDYDKAFAISSPYTTTQDGWIMAYCGGGDWQRVTLVINGTTFLYTGRKSYNTGTCMTAFIEKGQTAEFSSAGGVCRFVPCKHVR